MFIVASPINNDLLSPLIDFLFRTLSIQQLLLIIPRTINNLDADMNEETVKKLALVITTNCTRNSCLDECLKSDSFSQEQFDLLNKQISDRIYTFLTFLLNKPAEEYSVMMVELGKHFPENWSMPDLEPSFMQLVDKSSSGSMSQQTH